MSLISVQTVVGTTITFSFILVGNAITQSFMSVPAVLVDFPRPGSPEHVARAQLLGRQWPLFWKAGNSFFRPISTLGIFGYAFTSWAMAQGKMEGDWRLLALSSLCHFVNVVHSAVNMQPLNDKLEALSQGKNSKVDIAQAENYGRSWIKGNHVRIVCPLIAGSIALSQSL